MAQAGTTVAVVEVELWALPAGAGAEVGKKPTAADVVGRWGHDSTPSDTLEEHCRTELPQPSASLLPCGRGSHCPR
jgi:hypothetical protein